MVKKCQMCRGPLLGPWKSWYVNCESLYNQQRAGGKELGEIYVELQRVSVANKLAFEDGKNMPWEKDVSHEATKMDDMEAGVRREDASSSSASVRKIRTTSS